MEIIMTPEEKAKAYDEAFERAKKLQENSILKKWLLYIFPELKENEDERIRKEIIRYFTEGREYLSLIPCNKEEVLAWLEKQKATNDEIVFRPLAGTDIRIAAKQSLEKIEIGKKVVLAFNGAYIPVNGKTVGEIENEYDAWLEKQGEKEINDNDIAVLENWENAVKENKEKWQLSDWFVEATSLLVRKVEYMRQGIKNDSNKTMLNACINALRNVGHQHLANWLEKQGEQKSDDKVEPKFKVGDWIVNNISKVIFLIKSINNGYYTLEDINGNIMSPCLPPYESEFHLWTINDAKHGDVLAYDTVVLIFDHLGTFENRPIIYSWYFADSKKFYGMGTSDPDRWEVEGFYPATKEQRDLLFQKMKEAGYEWNAGKKELRNVEQKPAWSEEDERILDALITSLNNEVFARRLETLKGIGVSSVIDWLKSIKHS